MPRMMEEITTLADNYDAPEQVESIFTWDVTDVFYNYFFIGDAINLGGEAGWDKSQLDIYNADAIKSLNAYQSLNQFFSIDTADSQYSHVIADFVEGKIVFTIATTDSLNTLEAAKANGEFNYEYAYTLIPDMNEDIDTRSLSITDCVVINPFSTHIDIANDFAYFMTTDYANIMYSRSGKVPVYKNIEYENEGLKTFAEEYGYSISMPKIMETSNFWVQLEAVFADIWNGEKPNDLLKELAEKMIHQVTNEECELEYIEEVSDEEEIEYYDEDAERASAQSENNTN